MRTIVVLVTAVVGMAAAGRSFAQRLPPGVAECRARIEQQRNATGEAASNTPQRLGDVCPEIVAALDASIWGDTLDGSSADLTPREFTVLTDLARRYVRSASSGRTISTAALDAAVADVETEVTPPPMSLWDRVMQWFQDRFGRDETEAPGWLEKWLRDVSVPERVTRYIVIVLAVALAAATAGIVINELRVAGLFGRSRTERARRLGDADEGVVGGSVRARSLADVRHAATVLQPVLLLRLVVERLRSRVPLGDNLTHRELVRASNRSLSAAQLASLSSVATAAERVTYGDWVPGADEVATIVDDGETLIGSLGDENAEHA